MYLILIFSTGFFIPIPFSWTLLFPLSSLSWRDCLCFRSAIELPLWGSPLLWILNLPFSFCPRFSVVWLRNSVQWLETLTKHSRCPVFLANGTSPLTEDSPLCYRGALASQSIWDNIFIHHNTKAFPNVSYPDAYHSVFSIFLLLSSQVVLKLKGFSSHPESCGKPDTFLSQQLIHYSSIL